MDSANAELATDDLVIDAHVLAAVTAMLRARTKHMGAALRAKDSPQLEQNKHLDEGTVERAYWHAGYVTAMRDVLRMIDRREEKYPVEMPARQR
jgi:hypothetical protein